MDATDNVYRVGNTLKLRTVERQENVTVDIIDIFLPFTWSAVLKVKLYKGTINENVAVLKLYDRRRCPGLRKDYQKPPWTPTRDEEYLEFVRNGGATEFISRITSNGHLPESKFSAVEDEAWIQERCRRLWRSESGTYQTLKDLQGVCVPRLLYEVICCPTTSLGPTADLLEVPGTLIDFIDGFNLKDMFLHIPKDHWQSVCTQAVNVVNHISDHNILNQDARMHNMIVRTRKREGATTGPSSEASVVDSYDVFEIDFGLCRNRGPDETDDQWNEAKWRQHEDENIGAWLQVTARKDHGVEIEWRGTRRYDGPWVLDNLADDFPYEEFLISEMNESSVELHHSTRRLLEKAQYWPHELRDRIFMSPSRYVMLDKEKDGQPKAEPPTLQSRSVALSKIILFGWVVSHLIIFLWR